MSNCASIHRWSTRTLNNCIPSFCLWKQGTEERYWEQQMGFSRSRIFRSDHTEMVRSIWCTNRNYRNFGLNGKRPQSHPQALPWQNKDFTPLFSSTNRLDEFESWRFSSVTVSDHICDMRSHNYKPLLSVFVMWRKKESVAIKCSAVIHYWCFVDVCGGRTEWRIIRRITIRGRS